MAPVGTPLIYIKPMGYCLACRADLNGSRCPVHPEEILLDRAVPEHLAQLEALNAGGLDQNAIGLAGAIGGAASAVAMGAIAAWLSLATHGVVLYAVTGLVLFALVDRMPRFDDPLRELDELLSGFRTRTGKPAGDGVLWLLWPAALGWLCAVEAARRLRRR